MEITKFGLKNFRVFKEHYDFDLAPIMVLTGPNNSGKSSLTKALLLIKENEDVINLDESYSNKFKYLSGEHYLGSHNNVKHSKSEAVTFSFTFFSNYKFCLEILEDGRIPNNFIVTTEDNKLVVSQYHNFFEIDVQNLIEYIKIRLLAGSMSKKTTYKKIEKLRSSLITFAEEIDTIDINFFDILSENSNTKEKHEKNLKNRIYNGYFDDSYDLGNIKENDLAKFGYKCLIHIFHRITNVTLTKKEILFLIPVAKKDFFAMPKLVYMHTLKESFKRGYSNNDNFEFTRKLRTDYSNEKYKNYADENKFILKASKKKDKNSIADLRDRKKTIIGKWLKEFGIGKKLTYGYNEEFDTFFIKIDGKSLLDYGLGFGLIIQILLALENGDYLENKKERRINFPPTYIIEEPETGLHPAFQSKMAEMLVDIQKTFKVNLIIETHSEYLIRKFKYLTATNEIKPGDALIYYFNNPKKVPEGEDQIKKITIDENGSLSDNFGSGFIDEGTNVKFELLRFNKSRNN